MRPRDFVIPLGLIGAIAAFIVVQGADLERSRPRRARNADERPDSAVETVVPQGTRDTIVMAPADSAALAPETGDDLTTTRRSAEPAPTRDSAHIRELIQGGSPGTYLREMLAQQDGFLMRWPSRRTAVRVWIDRDVSLPDWNATYPVVAEHAFEEWQQAGFPLRFDVLRDATSTEIQIRWVTKLPSEDGQRIGSAMKTRDQHGWIVAAEIIIATHDSEGRPLPASVVAGAARHEIGHALGLSHSGSEADVMYPESRTTVISPADRATLHILYLLPPGKVQ